MSKYYQKSIKVLSLYLHKKGWLMNIVSDVNLLRLQPETKHFFATGARTGENSSFYFFSKF